VVEAKEGFTDFSGSPWRRDYSVLAEIRRNRGIFLDLRLADLDQIFQEKELVRASPGMRGVLHPRCREEE
jgi:hypothetical protein